MTSVPAFNTTVQTNDPLSQYLDHLVEQLGLRKRLQQVGDLAELDDFERTFADSLAAGRPALPSVGGLEVGKTVQDIGRPAGENGLSIETITRYYFALPIQGDQRLLMRWPDRDETGLNPVDAESWEKYHDTINQNPLHRYLYDVGHETWVLSPTTDPGEQWALYGYIDLTLDQEQQVNDGELTNRTVLDDRMALVRRFVDAIAKQTADYFDFEAPQEFRRLIQDKRRTLTNRAAVTADLGFPESWKTPALRVEEVEDDAGQAAAPVNAEQPTNAVVLATRHRLAPASFAEVLQVIRVWANSVERFGRSFSKLTEDQISDLLCATLNATLPGAQRKVYSRSGKSDIFIQADKLAEGSGPAKIFICESKWATDDTVVTKALDPQMLGYLITHDTAAVLLLLMPQQNLQQTVDRRLAALKQLDGYIGESTTASGWPALEYHRDGRTVSVCVATVHLPRSGYDSDSPPES
jgi:hypothetical protein